MNASKIRAGFSVVLLGLLAAGCPANRYEVFKQGTPWQFLTPAEGDLNPDAGRQAAGYVFDVPVEGEIFATLNLQNPGAVYNMFLLKEGVGQPIATAPGRAGQPVRLQGKATAGRFGIAIVAAAGASRFTLDTALKPNDPVAKSKCPNAMQPAVIAFGAAAAGKVAWASQEQSCFYKIAVPADGILKTRVQAKPPGKPSVSLVNAQGAEEALAVPTGSKEVKAGDWFVRVYANDITDFAEYQLVVDFETGDCNMNSGDDGDQEGAKAVATPGAVKGDLNFDKGDCIDWHKVELKEKGKLGVWCRPKTKGTKMGCEVVKSGEEEGPRSTGSTWFFEVPEPGTYYIKAAVDDRGAATAYDMTTSFVPAMMVNCDVLELEGSPSSPKALILSCGRNKGVVAGLMGQIKCGDTVVGTVMVDQVYPDVCKAKVVTLTGKFDPSCKVILGQ